MGKKNVTITFSDGKPVTLPVTEEEAKALVDDLKTKEWVVFKGYHFNAGKVNYIHVSNVPTVVDFNPNKDEGSAMV